MVFFYTSTDSKDKQWQIYMGRDKFENEDLIKYGLTIDLWFHVDDLSSAHVYLVLLPGYTMETIPAEVLEECCQLVKANSIEGCKKSSVKIVYTPWENLNKRGDMATGQIGFHDTSQCRYFRCEKKNEIVNRITKTKVEKPSSSIRERKDEYDRVQRTISKRAARLRVEKDKEENSERVKKQQEHDEFASLFDDAAGKVSNKNTGITAEEYENDFM